MLKVLYDRDVLAEEAILAWADEKAQADEADRVFLKKVCRVADMLFAASNRKACKP